MSIHIVSTTARPEQARARAVGPARRMAGISDDPAWLRAIIDGRLALLLPQSERRPQRLHAAMRHAALSPGKRFRPMLTLLASFECGRRDLGALDAACALELVHAASLVLDDLPAMDDAALRRGQPTTHRLHGADIAMLASVGLLNRAFAILAGLDGAEPGARLALVSLLAETVGSDGLLGGQEQDLRDAGACMDAAALDALNQAKTGVLLAAALQAGALIGGAGAAVLERYRQAGLHLGNAFQTLDDILDATASEAMTGKNVRKDGGKPSLVTLKGLDAARRHVREEVERGCALLGGRLGTAPKEAGPLARFVRQSFAAAGA